MMNRYALLLTAALGMAAAQTAIPAVPVQAPAAPAGSSVKNALRDSSLTSASITVNTGTYVGPLSILLASIAKSAGYEVIFNFNVDALALINGEIVNAGNAGGSAAPVAGATATSAAPNAPIVYASPIGKPQELAAKPVAHNFVSKPFNEVWPLLMDVYELNYEVLKLGNGQIVRISQRPRQLSIALVNIAATTAREKATEFFGEAAYRDEDYTANDGSRQTRKVFDGYRLPDTLKILADSDSNRLIVGGTNEQTDKVRSFISTIDIPKSATTQAQLVYTAKSSPADVVNILQGQYPALKATPIGQTARVIIAGSQADLDAALKLLADVDQPSASGTSQTIQRVYTVNGRQEDVVALLGKQYPTLNVSPVGTTGKVVLSGPEDLLTAALTLLGQVDRSVSAAPTPDNQVQVYSARGKADDVSKFLAAQYPGLKVTPIGTTERLVISGAQDQLSAALALLDKVDVAAPNAAATVQRVFTLVNASAEAVKATLEGTLARDVTANALTSSASLINPVTGQPYTSGNLANLPLQPQTATQPADAAANATAPAAAQPATIIADTRTNTVIVRGTSEQVEQVAALIPQLDQKVPQINVQVRIQEITETAARSLGMDWKVGFGGFQVSAGSGGLGASFDPTRSLVGFNVLPSLNALQNQGLSKSVYDGSITMQSGQRALDSASQTQNASGAAAASIKSGGRLEINIPSAAANVPGIQKQIDYGVNLDFYSPQVAPDGSITLRVRGQVNDLRTAITADTVPNILQFVNSEAQTTLTFKNGETLLLSGLLKTVETKNNDGVPFLSSLPVVGGLFGRDATRKEQTQLLVVITGNIVK
ncbi:type II secretion system protein GspD [Deinococcus arenicola]|uniref:Secretin n=1 Tax=Deinococcus arenicola TaxID=2994950 RepID=A0ABU4DR97_9DEIO|nr:secretin N-terminal domain-containing protein [Deinococcus sp. ZS9-10]MDV6374952.1 secretin [Deinococcus sp. ZS9-10]